MLRIAIVGCGKIADSHAAQIRRIPGVTLAAVCDREPLLAEQLAERFEVSGVFSDVGALLEKARPNVVHITTPPQSHCEIGKQCLSGGANVYVEKPFTLDLRGAEELVDFATTCGLKLTAGHNAQFTHAARRMRDLINAGYIGGTPLHLESTWCYDLGDQAYAKAVLGDKQHWLRSIPGKLLQNIISHGVARLAEHLPGDSLEVVARGFSSPLLTSLGETEIVDELRTVIIDGHRTAYFTFSSQMRPSHHQFSVFGPRNGLLMDEDQQTVLKLKGSRYKSYAEVFVPPLSLAKQYFKNLSANARLFLRNDFHPDASKRYLFERFYDSILNDTPLPIPYREILLTTRIMECMFTQLNESLIRRETPISLSELVA